MVRAYLASVKVGTARYITFHKIGKLLSALTFAFGDLTLLAGRQEGHPACKKQSGGVLVVVCLEQGADLHMAQLIPLPLTVSCFSKSRLVLPFWYRLTWIVLKKGPLNGRVCAQ